MNRQTKDSKPLSRTAKAGERREAIIEAAKKEFIAEGFAAACIDDIAKKAGVAKGTVYFHFADKKTLFEETIRAVMLPLVNKAEQGFNIQTSSMKETYEKVLLSLLKNMMSSDAGPIIRLLISEAIRFPQLGEFYRRDVISPMMEKQKILLKRAAETGELRNPAMADYPQLLMAPVLLTVIWQGAFSQLVPADVSAMIKVHLDLLFKESTAK